MVDPVWPLEATHVWLQRVARVQSRVGQVWTRTDGFKETLLVIDAPTPTIKLSTLGDFFTVISRRGWCHRVFCLERGERFEMNEIWFADSESGKASVFGRVV